MGKGRECCILKKWCDSNLKCFKLKLSKPF